MNTVGVGAVMVVVAVAKTVHVSVEVTVAMPVPVTVVKASVTVKGWNCPPMSARHWPFVPLRKSCLTNNFGFTSVAQGGGGQNS